MVLVVPANSPYRNVAELVSAAKEAPGKSNFASGTATYHQVVRWSRIS